ncbi:unnamed protein product [Bursaphelenchus okinawaensis]|uniref:Ubiquitin-like protease family profile domain-containing protein n=1 Tax=Bursaphelenchus okinawaensis TaxID=465554 RepID=A0A811K512_9BILA|nr:unnamed protein product [Bursaphelenchus okinawaensis]CAG9091494.1 unnamed protein product [Bursaphelenchus okinawaensis]
MSLDQRQGTTRKSSFQYVSQQLCYHNYDQPCSSTSFDKSKSASNIGELFKMGEREGFNRSLQRLKCRSIEHEADFNRRQSRTSISSLSSLIDGIKSKLSLEGLRTHVDVPPEIQDFPVVPHRANELCSIIWDRYEDPDEVFSSKFNIDVTRKDLMTLAPGTWLNDEIVNFYFSLIAERSKTSKIYPKVYCFNTFFFPTLCRRGYDGIKRWTKNVNIFENDLVIFPIHLGCHWCLAAYDCNTTTLRFLDSMGSDGFQHLKVLRDYIVNEYRVKCPEHRLSADSIILISKEDVPLQKNGFDCGVFTCRMGEYVSRRATLNFSQRHMPEFRRRILYEIVEQTLI